MRVYLILLLVSFAVTAHAGRYAIVKDGKTVNRVLWDGSTPLTLPEGCDIVPESDAPTEAAPSVREWTATEFFERFTPGEFAAITEAAKTDPVLTRFMFLAASSPIIHANDPRTQQAMLYLVSKSLITEQRRKELLSEAELEK